MKTSRIFQKKILRLLIIVFIVPFVFVYFVLLSEKYDTAKNQQNTVNGLFLNNEAAYVEKLLYLVALSINDISRNPNINEYLSSESAPSPAENLDFYSVFRNTYITEYNSSFSRLGGFLDSKDRVSIIIFSPNENLLFSDFLKPYDELDENIKKSAEGGTEIQLLTNDENKFFIFKPLYFKNSTSPAVIVLAFSSDIFIREYNPELSDNGDLILKINNYTCTLNSARMPFKGKTFEAFNDIAVPDYTWINGTITYISSADRITNAIKPDLFIISASFIFLLTVIVIVFYYMSKYLTNRLYFIIDDISSDIETKNIGTVKKKNDEFDIIRNKIMDMTQIINRKEKELFINEIEKKNIETRLLQELFNPHFLYNTLACIKYKFKGNETLEKIVDEMVNYYRVALNRGSMEIKLHKELAMIESYVLLQNFAYEKEIDLNITIDEKLKEHKIIKMLLQPLVENAFSHAFPNGEKNPIIAINVKESDENIVIRVTDNGIGMDPGVLSELLENPGQSDEFGLSHYGLYNTGMKIKTFYGAEYGLCIQSNPGEGTEVKIELPKNMLL